MTAPHHISTFPTRKPTRNSTEKPMENWPNMAQNPPGHWSHRRRAQPRRRQRRQRGRGRRALHRRGGALGRNDGEMMENWWINMDKQWILWYVKICCQHINIHKPDNLIWRHHKKSKHENGFWSAHESAVEVRASLAAASASNAAMSAAIAAVEGNRECIQVPKA